MVRIDKKICNGCPARDIPFCAAICPGSLPWRGKDGKAEIRDMGACWDCCACVKACPRGAIAMELPFQISEVQHRLNARLRRQTTKFDLYRRNGSSILKVEVPAKTSN